MGPRQSLPDQSGAAAGSSSGSRGVRTGATNSALVRNFDHLFGSHLGGDGADQPHGTASTPSRTPRQSVGGADQPLLSGVGGSSGHLLGGPDQQLASQGGGSPAKQPPQQQQQQPQRPEQPLTTPLCVRYKFQPAKQSNSQQQQPQPKGQPQLPPPPQQGVTVDLYDGDGKPVQSLPLNRSEGEFFAVVPVQMPGLGEQPLVQYFRFNVDGRPICHPQLPQNPLPGTSTGEPANYVSVENPENRVETKEPPAVGKDGAIVGGAPAAADDDGGWSQNPPQFEETRKFPPIMPPHLRYTPLNAPPSQFRCDQDGNVVPVTDEGAAVGAEQRPAPLSVTINHVYFQRREDHTLVGITARFRDKFSSIAFYKHDPVPAGAVPMAIPMPLPRG